MDSLKNIINLVFFVDIEDRTRKRQIVDARRAYSKILRDSGFSYEFIGKSINKDHATIIHYVKSVDSLLKYDAIFEKKFILAKKNFLEENKHLMLNSKEDIYAIAISLENRLNELISKREKINELLDKYEKENKECVDFCREVILPLFDS
jgi:hypothetical protein